MPLRVLDGNQTATTLSSVVTGGEHIVAHTVVSLGSTAISNITSAVSGSVVSISNFPATQTIAGTVTANLADVVANDLYNENSSVRIMGSGNNGVILQGIDVGLGSSNIFEGGGVPVIPRDDCPNFPISGTVTVGNSVTIGSLPAISGTVTANGGDGTFLVGGLRGGSKTAFSMDVGTGYLQTKVESMPAISGTITIGVVSQGCFGATIQGYDTQTGQSFGNCVPVKLFEDATGLIGNVAGTVTVGNSVTIGSLPTLTPQLPRVTFIDGSGSVTTANTAVTVFASSSTRSYLLVQVTTGSAFVNVGATATTVNGISLTAGQGYAWETTIPQGLVSLISTTTNSAYVAKQA